MRLKFPRVQGESPREKLIRIILLIAVFAAVGWAFSKNNEQVLKRIQERNAVFDQTATLSESDEEFIRGFVDSMKKRFGITVNIKIYKGAPKELLLDNQTLYLGLSPETGEVILKVPPLMRPALGTEFIDDLVDKHFAEAFTKGTWPRELKVVLTMIWSRLIAIDNPQGESS